DNSGTVRAFRATFEQHCEGGPTAARGEIRYDARVALDVHAPASRTVSVGKPLAFDVTAASYDSSHVTLSTGALPDGATFTDHGDNSGTFRWTPTFAQVNTSPLVTFFGTNAGGATDSVQTRITVTGITSLRMSSDAGDPIGNGQ